MCTGCTLNAEETKKESTESNSSFFSILSLGASSGYSNKKISLYNENNELLYEVSGELSYDIEGNVIEIKVIQENGKSKKQILGVGNNMYYTITEVEENAE